MSVFKNSAQREKFMKGLGSFYAGIGGMFGVYRDAQEAFESAKNHTLYSKVEFGDAEFLDFQMGFDRLKEMRVALNHAKNEAQAELDSVLREIELSDQVVLNVKDAKELMEYQEKNK